MLKEMSKMHEEDAHDDNLIAMEASNDTPALLQTMHAKTLHFCRRICRRTPLLETILPPRARPLHTTKMTLIYMQILPIIANLRSQKHWHVILSKLAYQNTTPQTRRKDARCWSQGQENLIEEICFDCEIHSTAIIEKCTHTNVLHQPGTKD